MEKDMICCACEGQKKNGEQGKSHFREESFLKNLLRGKKEKREQS